MHFVEAMNSLTLLSLITPFADIPLISWYLNWPSTTQSKSICIIHSPLFLDWSLILHAQSSEHCWRYSTKSTRKGYYNLGHFIFFFAYLHISETLLLKDLELLGAKGFVFNFCFIPRGGKAPNKFWYTKLKASLATERPLLKDHTCVYMNIYIMDTRLLCV